MPAKRPAQRQTRSSWGQRRKERSGRYSVFYDHEGERHRTTATFETIGDADAWLRAERRLIDRGEWNPPAERLQERRRKALTFAEYAAQFLEHRTLTHRTRSEYDSKLRLHILPKFGDTPLPKITPDAVRRWYAGLGEQHPTRNRHAYSMLHTIMAQAVEDGVIDANPVRIRGALRPPRRKENDVLSVAELNTVADAMPPADRLSVLLAAWSGLRRGETFELRRKDFAADFSKFKVERAVTRDRATRRDVVGEPKAGSKRTVTVPDFLRPFIAEHFRCHVAPNKDALIFPDPKTGGHMRERQYGDRWRAALASAGIEGQRVHDLRAFGATMTAFAGGTLREVQHRLGHTTVNAAMAYQRSAANRQAELAERLSELATGEPQRHLRAVD